MREVVSFQPEPPPVRERTVRITCQFCGAEAPRPDDDYRGFWAKGIDIDRVELCRERGYSCPEGGSKETEEYDCCPKCWDTKIKPALEALLLPGETANETESDW